MSARKGIDGGRERKKSERMNVKKKGDEEEREREGRERLGLASRR